MQNYTDLSSFKEVTINNLDILTKEFLPKVTEVLAGSTEFVNALDLDWFLINCPEQLLKEIIDIGGKINVAIVLKVDGNTMHKLGANSIHVDGGDSTHRLNLPLQNADSVETRLYKEVDINLRTSQESNAHGANFYREEDCELMHTLVLDRPIIFPVKIPHGLFKVKDKFPRYVLSIEFVQDSKIKKLLTGT